jgi:uncharacterized protein YjbI with pentapeptide repeats
MLGQSPSPELRKRLTSCDTYTTALRSQNSQYADVYYVRSDLANAHLNGANLEGADLSYAILRGVELREADLTGANLRGVIDFAHFPTGWRVANETLEEQQPKSLRGATMPNGQKYEDWLKHKDV